MIDLSTLIALLTALASATSPGSPQAPGPAPDPPSQTCQVEAPRRPGAITSTPGTPDRRSGTAPEITRPGATDHTERPEPSAADQFLDLSRATQDPEAKDEDEPAESTTRRPRSTRTNDSASTEVDSGERDRKETRTDDEPSTRTPEPDDTGAGAGDDRDPVPRTEERTYGSSTPGCDDRTTRPERTTPRTPRTTGERVPADLVDLGNWYLTLPTGGDGDPDTVEGPTLSSYSSTYFELNEAKDGVVFTAPVDGATTKNSAYPRSELREMNGEQKAAWSNGSGRHTLRATEAVTELPQSKPEVVTAQIHGGEDDVMQIRLDGKNLMVQYADGAKQVTLDPDYRLGTPYDIEIVAADNTVRVAYNGALKAELPLSGSTWYFKAGAYVQSNPTKGDAATAAGQVIIYSLEVTHA